MHELSIAQAIIDQAQDIATREQGRVSAVTVTIGSLSGVDPDALDQAFEIASEETALSGARLVIEKVPARIMCHSCNRESSPDFLSPTCLNCGSCDFEIVAGRELIIKSVDLDG
jgi:hydrogenase nickel incorporation protein HypA/HybF